MGKPVGSELLVDLVQRAGCSFVCDGGFYRIATARTLLVHAVHQWLDGTPGDTDGLSVHLLPDFVSNLNQQGLIPYRMCGISISSR
jgi:hypothetical protein